MVFIVPEVCSVMDTEVILQIVLWQCVMVQPHLASCSLLLMEWGREWEG